MIAHPWGRPARIILAATLAASALILGGSYGPAHAATSVACSATDLQTAASAGGDYVFAANCSLTLSSPITVSGQTFSLDANGYSVTLDGNHTSQLFSIGSGSTVTLTGLTLQNGSASGGGTIHNTGGSHLTVAHDTFTGNIATGGLGGAIDNGNNNSSSDGNGDVLTVTGSTFDNNSAGNGFGGAIENFCGNCTETIANSTFVGNTAGAGGGAVGNALGTTAFIYNSTVADNTGSNGILNSSGTLTIANTLLANNTGPSCGAGTINDQGYNLQYPRGATADTSCGFSTAKHDQFGDPHLAATLANNGGPTETLAVDTTGAAYNNGNPSVCAAAPVNRVDQRGDARGTTCTIGAFEPQSGSSGCVTNCSTATPELGSGELLATGLLPLGAVLLYRRRRTRRATQQQ